MGRADLLACCLLLALAGGCAAVNWVYDPTLWTKSMWESVKVSNPLAGTNPTDLDLQLAEQYPSVRGSLANSLDGGERRDPSSMPPGLDLGELVKLTPIDKDAYVVPAADAVTCPVCHMLADRVWFNMSSSIVKGITSHKHGMHGALANLDNPEVLTKMMEDACAATAADDVLSVAEILKLGDPSGTILFFVLRETRRRPSRATPVERAAVELACKRLVLSAGEDLAGTLVTHAEGFVAALGALLEKAGLLHAPPDDARAAARADAREGGAPAVGGDGADRASPELRALVATLTHALAKAEAAVRPLPPSSDDDDDDEMEDEMDPACRDLHSMCQQWADAGECEANPVYMVGTVVAKGHCRRSCGMCVARSGAELARLKGEASVAALMAVPGAQALATKHPRLSIEVAEMAAKRRAAARTLACTVAKACPVEGAGAIDLKVHVEVQRGREAEQQPEAKGWELGTQFYGPAKVSAAAGAKQVAAGAGAAATATQGKPPPGSIAADQVHEVLRAELGGKKLSVPGDFFVYELTYKVSARHFHAAADGMIDEDYNLGSFVAEAGRRLPALEPKDLLPPLSPMMRHKRWPYVKQVYSGGDMCTLAGGVKVVRSVEARLACSPDGKLSMLVREPDFCKYVFVVYSPALCGVEGFAPDSAPGGFGVLGGAAADVQAPERAADRMARAMGAAATATAARDKLAAMAAGKMQVKQAWALGAAFYGEPRIKKLETPEQKIILRPAMPPPKEGSVAAQVNGALEGELFGRRLSIEGEFFTYEYIFRDATRHFHVDNAAGRMTEDYSLGKFEAEVLAGGASMQMLQPQDLLPSRLSLMAQSEWPYVKQVYSGGDMCTLAGGIKVVRSVEARLACSPDGKLSMLVREPDFCTYVFVVYSPALCAVEQYKPVARVRGGGSRDEL